MPGQAIHTVYPKVGEVLTGSSATVTLAGTAEPLSASSVPCIDVLIQVQQTNTGQVYIGGSTVPNTGFSAIVLAVPVAGITPPAMPISAQNLNQVYINADVNGDGVNFIYW